MQFKQSLLATLILLLCVPIFIKLGMWQFQKAELKQSIQEKYLESKNDKLVLPTLAEVDWESWKYKKITVNGYYDTQYEIFLDNQVEQQRIGYHVITPLKLKGRDDYVLVNRGWVAADNNRKILPKIKTPVNFVDVTGQVWIPSKKNFTLESEEAKLQWQKVWQYMDMDRYQKKIPIKLLPIVIRLDSSSQAGGFVRNWQIAPDRIVTHLGYAYQWFGFAVASILIYLYTGFKRKI